MPSPTNWLGAAAKGKPLDVTDPVLERMRQRGVPITRANYIAAAGLEEPLGAEEEWMLPPELSRVAEAR